MKGIGSYIQDFLKTKKPEETKEIYHFVYRSNEYGTIGVFKDYENCEILAQEFLKKSSEFFPLTDINYGSWGRNKHRASVSIDGNSKEFFVKCKIKNKQFADECMDDDEKYLNMFSRYGYFNREEPEDRRCFSVLNELISNRKASQRYYLKFKKILPIETPVGFFISHREEDAGARMVIFEKLEEVYEGREMRYGIDMSAVDFQKEVTDELRLLNVRDYAFGKVFVDVILAKFGNETKHVIVDSEAWKISKVLTQKN